MKQPKLLFILKRREDFDPTKHTVTGMQTGLFNSASFVSNMLVAEGVDSIMELAIDNNCIDRLVTKHKPTHVIIEALWVVPSKFHELCKLHPTVTWVVRLHSETPFLAQEGMAFDWLGDYACFQNIIIGVNAPRMTKEVELFLSNVMGWDPATTKQRVAYLPNYYPHLVKTKTIDPAKDHVDVGCFGAVRPLKNHAVQVFAALKFANMIGKKLHFHINARVEGKGDPVLSNLKNIFQQLHQAGHRLISHEWAPRNDFLKVCAKMDVGMQVSFSETFNIVGCDLLSQGVPIVGSYEIPWLHDDYKADPTDHNDIAQTLLSAYTDAQQNVDNNSRKLSNYSDETRAIWLKYFNN